MAELKGTKTEANLQAAFAGESQARNKYTYYASQARKEGYEQVAAFFEETAGNEKEHAKLWFKLLHNGMPKTETNLDDAAGGENYEWTNMYKTFSAEAKAEGFDKISELFAKVGAIEKEHEERYRKLKRNLADGAAFEREPAVEWHCRNCGYTHKGGSAPDVCPVCAHPKAYFEIKSCNY